MIEAIKAALVVLQQEIDELQEERDKYFEHSVMLNQACYRISLALRYMNEGEDYLSEQPPLEIVQELIDKYEALAKSSSEV